MPVSPARSAALEILLRVEKTGAYASELLHSARLNALSTADHGLATELVMGVLRWRSVLDEHIAAHSKSSLAKFDLAVLTALRLGAYQLIFFDRVPKHAAVNESVELVKHARKRSAAGMVNAVLRAISQSAPCVSEHIDSCAAHPEWLVKRWTETYGIEPGKEICNYDQTPPRAAIRVTGRSVIEELRQDGIKLEPGGLLRSALVVRDGDITQTKAFREHRVLIQDEGSQLVALLVGKGRRILDCCAAPGGKTRIVAEQNPDSTVVALELHPHRSKLLRKLVPNYNVRVIAADARQLPLAMKFDRVLVDAPCTGTGTLARNPDIKWRLKGDDIHRLQKYQVEILSAAMNRVASGGRVIYSTCSLEPEENEEVVDRVLSDNPSFLVTDCRDELDRLKRAGELIVDDVESLLRGPFLRTIPGIHPCDGFFAAVLEGNAARL
jgi:16S rRNA (cytosine967-C5)-methyltransferase